MARRRRRCRPRRAATALSAIALLSAACAHLPWTGEEKAMLVLDRPALRQYRMVISGEPTEAEARAGSELQRQLREITGVAVRLVLESAPPQEGEFLLGRLGRLRELGIEPDRAALGKDGFAIQTRERRLAIAGSWELGTQYGVCTFLEDCLGCRLHMPGVRRLPPQETLRLPAIDTV